MGSSVSSQPPPPPPDTDAHLQPINPTIPANANNGVFHPFPRLPTELRHRIWRHSLQHHRLVRIYIYSYKYHPDVKASDNPNDDSNTHHYPVVIGHHVLPKLLHVNRDARFAALSFYRVVIPCRFSASPDAMDAASLEFTSRGIFYFNPEWDVLHLKHESVAPETAFEFLHHLKTLHDPRRAGLLNLAITGNDLTMLLAAGPRLPAEPSIRQAYRETLAQLRRFYVVEYTRPGRQCEGWRSGYCGDVWFNRSFPIMGYTPVFNILQHDPRPIEQDLTRVYTGSGGGRTAEQITELFETWDVKPPDAQFRYLLAFEPQLPHIVFDRDSAMRYLKMEDDHWKWCAVGGSGDPDKPFGTINWPALKNMPEEDLEAVPRPAIGFWLFPMEIFAGDGFPNGPVNDLSKFRPELGLLQLP